jgi:hypothetical protein
MSVDRTGHDRGICRPASRRGGPLLRPAFVLAFLLLTASACSGAIGLRLGAGVETMPLKFIDLENYNDGVGADIRTDIVWGVFSTTSLEMGYREFPIGGAWPDYVFALRRFGLLQRFYPLYARQPRLSPYLGLGLTATNNARFSLNIPDADYGGWAVMMGVEIPKGERLRIDPAVRWDFFYETDYFYSAIGLDVHLIWKLK